jgi:hypothetical protein
MENEHLRSEALDRRSQIVRRNLETKLLVVEDLRSGRLCLYEAADRFRDLTDPGIEDYPGLLRLIYPAQSDDERWCRQVIGFVRGASTHCPAMLSLAEQLEAQLTRDLSRGPLPLTR